MQCINYQLINNKNFIRFVTVNTNTHTSACTKHPYTQKENVKLSTAFKDQIV